ncbi:hypothetical protein M0R04_11820 [Candidatus Dojkabacteria bacterium]|nr:hypothetical protein [Candidatus Dojkabacteria bacterium]
MFNHPGWEIFSKELETVYSNSDSVIHNLTRKEDREIHIGRCSVVKDIFDMVRRYKKEADGRKKE